VSAHSVIQETMEDASQNEHAKSRCEMEIEMISVLRLVLVILFFAANTLSLPASAYYIYTPTTGAAYLPVQGLSFPKIVIGDDNLQDLGNGLYIFSVHTGEFTGGSLVFDLAGTLRIDPSGVVSEWDVTQSSGTRYYTTIAITRFRPDSFFESLETQVGICCTFPEGPMYSLAPGEWVHSASVPAPAPWVAFLISLGPLVWLRRKS
jgi:hypothetical protein